MRAKIITTLVGSVASGIMFALALGVPDRIGQSDSRALRGEMEGVRQARIEAAHASLHRRLQRVGLQPLCRDANGAPRTEN